LPCIAVLSFQKFVGAILTGTHPGSLYHRALADYVTNFRLVKPDGGIEDVDCKHPLFRALPVSLGMFGVISKCTVKAVPAYLLRERRQFVSTDDWLNSWAERSLADQDLESAAKTFRTRGIWRQQS